MVNAVTFIVRQLLDQTQNHHKYQIPTYQKHEYLLFLYILGPVICIKNLVIFFFSFQISNLIYVIL